jgi:hypothetical protein
LDAAASVPFETAPQSNNKHGDQSAKMPEVVRQIFAGSHPVYDIVKSADGLTITIRSSEDHTKKIDLISSVVGTLIKTLQEIEKPSD